jgi:hypothetical protein
MENVTIFYGNLEYFTAIWYILWPFVNVVVVWYIFPRFGTFCQEKSGNPWRIHPSIQSYFSTPLRNQIIWTANQLSLPTT